MQGYDLVKDMGLVDDELVAGALEARAVGGWRSPSRWLAAAACLAVAALVGWGVWQGSKPKVEVPAEEGPSTEAPVVVEPTVDVPVTEESEAETAPAEDPIVEQEAPEISIEVIDAAEIEPQPISETSSAFAPNITDPDEEAYPTLTMIESYPSDGAEACYDYAVDNGAVGFSVPLTDAMDELGDAVLYRVYVEIFKDGVQLAPDDPEVVELMTSLINDGIVSAIETVYQNNQPVATYDTLHATYDQLQNFKADSGHGWMLFLYAERV